MAEGLDDELDSSMSYNGDVSCIANCLSKCCSYMHMHACTCIILNYVGF